MSDIQPILQNIHASVLRDFVAHWHAQRGGRPVPRRQDLDIFLFPQLLPHVFLYDYLPGPRDLVLRLAGEEIRRRLPDALPGQPLAAIMPPDALPIVQRYYRRVCEEPSIMWAAGRVFAALGDSGVGERICLPLADGDGRIFQMLGITLYQQGDHLPDGSAVASEEIDTVFFPL
ncbi:PAS domain-containing protein [Ferrovibrio sp.]|uniref:PAS domain-containing protein n=1 Tax=Ferrovibrio sp. TaxID=1917215 RepID=UPI00311DA697